MSNSSSDDEKYINKKLKIMSNCYEMIKKYLIPKNPFTRIHITQMNMNKIQINRIVTTLCNSKINPHLYNIKVQYFEVSLSQFKQLVTFLSYQCRLLTTITFKSNNMSDQSIKYIVQAQWLFLKHIDLQDNCINALGIKQFKNNNWKYLTSINLNNNPIKNTGIKQLVKHPWNNLKQICIDNILMTDDGIHTLLKGKWPKLKRLFITI